MTGRREKFNENEFRQDLIKRGGGSRKITGEAGDPDRLCWLPRGEKLVYFWAEWKRLGEPCKPHQLIKHDQLRDAGHTVYVFDNNERARETLDAIALGA